MARHLPEGCPESLHGCPVVFAFTRNRDPGWIVVVDRGHEYAVGGLRPGADEWDHGDYFPKGGADDALACAARRAVERC